MRTDSLPVVLVRRFLGVVFIAYGIVKLLGGQFVYDEWTITRSTADGAFLVWAFYGFSPAYAKFIGMCELIPGIMLLIPRTAFVGAAALFPVALNITVMDFAYGFPSVKYMVLFYTMLLAFLLWVDRRKIFMLFERSESTAVPAAAPRAPGVRRVVNVVATLFLLWVANLVAETTSEGPEPRAIAAASANGDSLVLRRSRYTGQSGFNRKAIVHLRTPGDTLVVRAVHLTRPFGFVPWRVDSITRP